MRRGIDRAPSRVQLEVEVRAARDARLADETDALASRDAPTGLHGAPVEVRVQRAVEREIAERRVRLGLLISEVGRLPAKSPTNSSRFGRAAELSGQTVSFSGWHKNCRHYSYRLTTTGSFENRLKPLTKGVKRSKKNFSGVSCGGHPVPSMRP